MPQSLARIIVHVIFSTKHRTPCLSQDIQPRLYAYMAGILQEWNCKLMLIGGVEDHVHILCSLSKNHAPSKVIEEVKKGSSKWIKTRGAEFRNFYWQRGYGMFSVSESKVGTVETYIKGQKKHHQTVSFQDEFRSFLKRYNIEYDERYVWD